MWEPRRLTTLCASMACYRGSYTFTGISSIYFKHIELTWVFLFSVGQLHFCLWLKFEVKFLVNELLIHSVASIWYTVTSYPRCGLHSDHDEEFRHRVTRATTPSDNLRTLGGERYPQNVLLCSFISYLKLEIIARLVVFSRLSKILNASLLIRK
jgi:hypothetical protein